MRQLLRRLSRSRLVENIFVLYGLQFASFLFPLATVPYLTRVLGPTAWGLLAFAWGFGQYVILLVEYGFNLSATREVAVHHNSRERLANLLAGVLGAKVMLAVFVIGLALLIQRWVPNFREDPALLWSSIFWALAQSFSLLWYYQGLERMRLVASLDTLAKALAAAGVFLLVRFPDDAWKVLILQGLASYLSMGIALGLAYREVPIRLPTWSLAWKVLKTGWSTFLFRSSSSLYTVGNTFILGFFAPPQLVGYYAGAETLSNAFFRLLEPFGQALYPRVSFLASRMRAHASRLAGISIAFISISGGLMGLLIFLLSPVLVRIVLGEQFDSAIPVLRVLAFVLPLGALSYALHTQWMLPLGMDRPLVIIITGVGFLNLVLALILAPRYAHIGMAWAVVLSELVLTMSSIYVWMRWRGSSR